MRTEQNMSRREMLQTTATGSIAALGLLSVGPLLSLSESKAAEPGEKINSSPILAGNHQVKPLSFSPGKLKGLSEKLITSHHENNYGGAVKNLNKVEQQIAQLKSDSPAFLASGLMQSELQFRNSMILHEFYFGNLGGNGKPQGNIEKKLLETYGSAARWEELFRLTGMGLAGGSGWVLLSYDLRDQKPLITWSGNHTQIGAFSVPLLVMDMYEHAYQMDYGAAAAKYIEAFFKNIQWEEVDRRFEHAQKIRFV